MLAWTDRAADRSIQEYDPRADDPVATRWRLRLSPQTEVPLSAFGRAARPIDVGSSVRILRGNDLLAGAAYMQYCSRLDTSECHSKSAPS